MCPERLTADSSSGSRVRTLSSNFNPKKASLRLYWLIQRLSARAEDLKISFPLSLKSQRPSNAAPPKKSANPEWMFLNSALSEKVFREGVTKLPLSRFNSLSENFAVRESMRKVSLENAIRASNSFISCPAISIFFPRARAEASSMLFFLFREKVPDSLPLVRSPGIETELKKSGVMLSNFPESENTGKISPLSSANAGPEVVFE